MAQAPRDQNYVPTALFESSSTPGLTLSGKIDQNTGRILVDNSGGGSGTVTGIIIATANGFAGSSDGNPITPTLTLETTVTGILQGNGTAISAASTTGSGAVVLQTSPTLITPDIGAATGTSLITSGALRSNTSLILEETGAGTDTITIQAPASIAASYTLTLPVDDGTPDQLLSTNGSGVLSWVSASGFNLTVKNGSTVSNVDTINFVGAVVTDDTGGDVTVTISTQVPGLITVANEATDTSCFVAFFTDATGNLQPKTNVNMTFNSNTGVVTFASSVLTTTDINGGSIDGTVIGASSAAAITGTIITANTSFLPDTDGGAALGGATLGFSILGLASGSTINFANGNVLLTHSSAILTMGTGDFRVTNAGTNGASVATLAGSQTLTNKILSGNTAVTLISGSGTLTLNTTGTITVPNATDTLVARATTDTLTNKRITPRVLSAASYTTDTGSSINSDTQDMFSVTAQAGALLFNDPTGTPTDGQKLIITVASSTTAARALTWGSGYIASTVALPSTTEANTNQLTIGFIWSAGKTKWICLAVA